MSLLTFAAKLPVIGPDSETSDTIPSDIVTVAFLGSPAITYSVKFRVRGFFHLTSYGGGSNDGAYLQIGGTGPTGDFSTTDNLYRLDIADPAQTFWFNRGDRTAPLPAVDYEFTASVKGGANLVLTADSQDSVEVANLDDVSVSDVVVSPQPYDGQWVQLDVVSVYPDPFPVQETKALSAGSALIQITVTLSNGRTFTAVLGVDKLTGQTFYQLA